MRKLENKKLDEIGKTLVRSGVVSSHDIERIVANPALFDSVRQRIASGSAEPVTKRSFMRPTVTAVASVASIVAIALAFVVFKSGSNDVVSNPTPNIATTAETKRFTEPDRIVDAGFRPADTPMKAERISTRSNSTSYSRPKQPAAPQEVRDEGDFYALSYAGDPNETEHGGRIVRVDIPRSTLFAMGVDIPLENEADTVKADLLVGTDGVTRAIRVVK